MGLHNFAINEEIPPEMNALVPPGRMKQLDEGGWTVVIDGKRYARRSLSIGSTGPAERS